MTAGDRDRHRISLKIAEQAIDRDKPLSLIKSDDELLARFIDKYGLDIAKGTDQHDKLERDMKRGYRCFLEDVLA